MTKPEDTISLTTATPAGAIGNTVSSTPLSRRLATAVPMTAVASVMTLGASTLANIVVARNGGPAGYAVYVTANMIVFVTATLVEFGLPVALAKHVAVEEEEGRHDKLKHTCTMTILISLLFTLLVGIAMSFVVHNLTQYLNVSIGSGFALFFPLILLCAVFSDFVQTIYFGLLRPRSLITLTTVGPVAMIVYILARRAGAPLPIWGAVVSLYICSGLLAAYKAWRSNLLGAPSSLHKVRPIFRDAAPSATFTFFTVFSTWSDRWVVGTQIGGAAMGAYTAAVIIIQAVLRVPTYVAYLLVPASSRVSLKGAEKSRRFNDRVVGMFATFAVAMATVITLAPSTLVRLIFGQGFTLAPPVLLIIALSLPAAAINIPFVSALTASKRNRMMIYLLGITLPPRIILLLYLTIRWSLLGTALAMVLSDYLLAACCAMLAHRIGMGFPLRALMGPILTGIVAFAVGLVALLLNASQFLAVAVACAIFMPLLWRSAMSFRKLAG